MIITDELARRLEVAEALDAVDCGEVCAVLRPDCGASVKAVAGGFCVFCGETSPLTHSLALGLHGPVSEEEVLEIEDFFRSRAAPVVIDVTPHADPSLRELLSSRGYHISEMSNVLVRRIGANECLPASATDLLVRPATEDEAELYGHTVVSGFLSREELTEEEVRLGQLLFGMRCATSLLAFAGSEVAGGCGMSIRSGVASFFGDATLPRFRRRGVHTALILERLRMAAESGSDVATAGTQPGRNSQRNYQRLGFEVAYSKITMVLE